MSDTRAGERVERLRQVARVWDELVPLPFLNRRIGVDALVGLLPGIGDVIGALVAGWGLVEAARLRAPTSVLLRMLYNIGLDALVGAIPLLGDLFDVGWKAQSRNVALLERWLGDPERARRRSTAVLVAVVVGLVAVLVAATWLALWFITRLLGSLVT